MNATRKVPYPRMVSRIHRYWLTTASLVLFGASVSLAVTCNWTGASDSDWFNAGNWSGGSPSNGDAVVITAVGSNIKLTNSTASLASFDITGRTMTFTNWATILTATNVTIESGGILTHSLCNTNVVMDNTNRIYIICSNLTVNTGGSIDVDYMGYQGGPSADSYGYGPSGPYDGGGGGYGGKGGKGYYFAGGAGPTYGSSTNPIGPGSGGGGHNANSGGAAGGAVRIEASGSVVVDGTITGNGHGGQGQGGGGSGAAIYISCRDLAGAIGGIISANGGNSSTAPGGGGGGGGGRMAIYYRDFDYFYGSRTVSGGIGSKEAGTNGTLYRVSTSPDPLLHITAQPVEYGNASPYPYGYEAIPQSTSITDNVPWRVYAAPGIKRGCYGWSLTTNSIEIDSGIATQAVFNMPAVDTVLTWNWTNLYELTVMTSIGGTATTNKSGFYTNDTLVQVSAAATGTYFFTQWTGDIPGGDVTNNPVTVTMDLVRSIQANFQDLSPQTRTWNGIGYWSSATNWIPEGAPGPNDTVIIGPGTVTMRYANSLAHLTVSNGATMVFDDWVSTLTATNVSILSGGTVTHTACNTNDAAYGSNRVHMVCSNLTIEAGGTIDVSDQGHRFAPAIGWGHGRGGGYKQASAGHGGAGSKGDYAGTAGATYGSVTAPLDLGSGGGRHNAAGYGHGGGAVRVDASGHVIVNGSILAKGKNGASQQSGGSGGSIYITCYTFASTNGVIRVDGGDGGTGNWLGAGGGGGRIAIVYNTTAQATLNLTDSPTLAISANQGYAKHEGYPGTIYLSDSGFFPWTNVVQGGQWIIPGFTSWTVNSLTINDGMLVFTNGMQLTISNNLTMSGNGAGIELINAQLNVGGNVNMGGGVFADSFIRVGATSDYQFDGNLTLNAARLYFVDSGTENTTLGIPGDLTVSGGSTLYITSAETNGTTEYGTLVNVGSDIIINASSWIYPISQGINGGSVLFKMRHLTIADTGGISANARGFSGNPTGTSYGYGPEAGYRFDGAGYGGVGGKGGYAGGIPGGTYGDSNAPALPGSGGGTHSTQGGRGGGYVWIQTLNGAVTVDGTVTANGGGPVGQSGSGSGGAIYIMCNTFAGAGTGVLSADGGNATVSLYSGGSGGGGRIAVYRFRHLYSGAVSVVEGTAYAGHTGTAGTIVWVDPPPGMVFFFR